MPFGGTEHQCDISLLLIRYHHRADTIYMLLWWEAPLEHRVLSSSSGTSHLSEQETRFPLLFTMLRFTMRPSKHTAQVIPPPPDLPKK